MVLGALVTLRIALDSVFVHGLCSLVHAEVFKGLCLIEGGLVHKVECRVLGLNLTESVCSFQELTVQVEAHSGAVVVFRFDLQATVTFFADFLFAGVTEAAGELDGPDEATVLLGVEVIVRHFEVESEVTEDAHVLDINRSAGNRVTFLREAEADTKVRGEVVGQGEAHFRVQAFATFLVGMEHVDEGKFCLRLDQAVEATPEEGEVQVRRNVVCIVAVAAEETRSDKAAVFFHADTRLGDVLEGDTHQEVTELRRVQRVPAEAHVGTERHLRHFIELVDVEHGHIETEGDAVHQPVGVTEHEGVFAVGLATVDGCTVFEERESEGVLVIHRESQAHIFLAGFATDGAEERSTEFQLVSFRDSSGVHIHGSVATEFREPVILLVLVRRISCFCKQGSAGYRESKDCCFNNTSTHHLLL